MELHRELKTVGILGQIIEDIRTVKKKRPDKKFITREAIKQGLTEELLSSSLDDLVSAGRLYVGNGSYFVSKIKQAKSNKVNKNGANDDKETNVVGRNANTQPIVGEKSSNFETTTPSHHPECPAPKTSVTNPTVPDSRTYETAGQLAATVADLHRLLERERELNRKIMEENFTLRHQVGLANVAEETEMKEQGGSRNNGDATEVKKPPIVYESIEVKSIDQDRGKKKKRKNKGINNKSTNTSENQSQAISQPSCATENNAATADAEIVTEDSHSQENKEALPTDSNHESKPSTEKVERCQQVRRTTVVMGDSLVKNVEGWKMTKRCERNEKIHVKDFSGATFNDMKHYCKPTVESKPDAVILHVGTNDLRNKNQSEVMLAQEIVSLAASIQKEKIDVTISGLVGRNDEHEDKRRRVNLI